MQNLQSRQSKQFLLQTSIVEYFPDTAISENPQMQKVVSLPWSTLDTIRTFRAGFDVDPECWYWNEVYLSATKTSRITFPDFDGRCATNIVFHNLLMNESLPYARTEHIHLANQAFLNSIGRILKCLSLDWRIFKCLISEIELDLNIILENFNF